MLRVSNEVTNAQIVTMFTSTESKEITGLHNRKSLERYFENRLDLWYERFILGFNHRAVDMEKVKAFDHDSVKVFFTTLASSLFDNTATLGVFAIMEQVERAHKNLTTYRTFHQRISVVRGMNEFSRIVALGFYLSLSPDSISLAESKAERLRAQTNERVQRLRAKRKEELESNPLHRKMTQEHTLRRAETIRAAAKYKCDSIMTQMSNLEAKKAAIEAQLVSLEAKRKTAEGNLKSAIIYLDQLRLAADTKQEWITVTLPQDLVDSDASNLSEDEPQVESKLDND